MYCLIQILWCLIFMQALQSLCGSVAGLDEQNQKSVMLKGLIAPGELSF